MDENQEEFVRLSLSDSTYAKVIFHQVKDSYESHQDLKCVYTHLSSTGTREGDFVGLFKVGWSSVKDYVVAVACEVEEEAVQSSSPTERNVTLKAESLPKEDGEYYQFCYITTEGELRGGSTPFSFKAHSSGEELFSVEDIENDLLLIQTRTTVLEESLQNAIKEKTCIQIEKQLLEKSLKQQKDTVASLETTVKTQEDVIKELKEKTSEIEANFLKKECLLKEEIVQNEHFIKGLRIALSALGKEKDELIAKLAAEEAATKALYENCTALQKNVDGFKKSETSLLEEIKRQQNIIMRLQENIVVLEKNSIEKSNQFKILEEHLETQHIQNKTLSTRLVDSENMLAAVMTSKSLATEELQKHLKKEAEFEKSKAQLIEQNHAMEIRIQKLEDEKADILKELDAAIARNSHSQEEAKIMLLKQEQLEEGYAKLQDEKKELHHRIVLGAEEYKRKYIDWFKLQKKFTKLQQKLVQTHTIPVTNCCDLNSEYSASSENVASLLSASSVNVHNSCDSTMKKLYKIHTDNQCDEDSECSSTSGLVGASADLPKYENDFDSTKMTSTTCKADNISSSPLHDVAHCAKIHAEMENQLLKFQCSKNSQNMSGSADSSIKEASVPVNSTSVMSLSYPYPPYYPYPYPDSISNQSFMNTSFTVPALKNFQNPYVGISQNVYETYFDCTTSREHPDIICEDSFCVVSSPIIEPLYNPYTVNAQHNSSLQLKTSQQQKHEFHLPASGRVDCYVDSRNATYVSYNAAQTIKCPLCTECFPEDTDINEHLDGHFYFTCPLCGQQFDKEQDGMEAINKHVCDHLD